MKREGGVFTEVTATRVHFRRIALEGTTGFYASPVATVVIQSETSQGRERRQAVLGPREKPRCMTTGTIFSKGRNKEVPRNSKQQVDEQLKTNSKSRAVTVGYGPSAKSPGRFRVCKSGSQRLGYTRAGKHHSR